MSWRCYVDTVRTYLGSGLEDPVIRWVIPQRRGQARREDLGICRPIHPRFQNTDGDVRILRQSRCEGETCGSTPNDQVIEAGGDKQGGRIQGGRIP